jgi:MFS family permease
MASRTLLKYYLFRAVTLPGFIMPINVLYLLYHDITFTQLATMGIITEVVIFTSEVPTGYLADRIGRRNSLILSVMLYTFVRAGFVFADAFTTFAALFAVLGIARTLQSGSVDAWLYETLAERDESDEFTRVRGRGSAIRQWVGAATMIAGGFLYVLEPTYPYVAATALSAIGVFVLLTLPANAQYSRDDDGDELTTLEAFSRIRERVTSPPLRSYVLYVGLFFAVLYAVNEYTQPITVDTLEPLLQEVLAQYDVPGETSLGFIFAGFTFLTAFASDRAAAIEERLGFHRTMLLLPVATGVVLVSSSLIPLVFVPLFFVTRMSKAVIRPVSAGYINDHVESFGRATVLSAVSLVYALVRMPFLLAGGVVADLTSPQIAVPVLGLVFLVLVPVVYLVESPSDPDTTARPQGQRMD